MKIFSNIIRFFQNLKIEYPKRKSLRMYDIDNKLLAVIYTDPKEYVNNTFEYFKFGIIKKYFYYENNKKIKEFIIENEKDRYNHYKIGGYNNDTVDSTVSSISRYQKYTISNFSRRFFHSLKYKPLHLMINFTDFIELEIPICIPKHYGEMDIFNNYTRILKGELVDKI